MTCDHEKLIPKGADEKYDLINWVDGENEDLHVNMCKKCGLVFWKRD